MARIVISTNGGIADKHLAAAVRGITNEGVAEVAALLRSGGTLLDLQLFGRPRAETFAKVRSLLQALSDAHVEPQVWESGRPISAHVLLNIMQSSDDSIAQFEQLGESGHEA